jgi:hypothetical protein
MSLTRANRIWVSGWGLLPHFLKGKELRMVLRFRDLFFLAAVSIAAVALRRMDRLKEWAQRRKARNDTSHCMWQ